MKSRTKYGLILGLATTVMICSLALAASAKGRPHPNPVVYVTSQGLFYDSIVLGNLPNKGPFQDLENAGPSGLQTEFGPGDPGYLGGRWAAPWRGAGEYFLCPLLPPGRLTQPFQGGLRPQNR